MLLENGRGWNTSRICITYVCQEARLCKTSIIININVINKLYYLWLGLVEKGYRMCGDELQVCYRGWIGIG